MGMSYIIGALTDLNLEYPPGDVLVYDLVKRGTILFCTNCRELLLFLWKWYWQENLIPYVQSQWFRKELPETVETGTI